MRITLVRFPISRDPPEGGTDEFEPEPEEKYSQFPISRDPPEGGTTKQKTKQLQTTLFPISRDPPEGGTPKRKTYR